MWQACKCVHTVYESGICSNMIYGMLYVTGGQPHVVPRTIFIVTLTVFCHNVNKCFHVKFLELGKYQPPIHFSISVKFTFELNMIQKSHGSPVGDISIYLLLFIMLERVFFFYIALEQKCQHFL